MKKTFCKILLVLGCIAILGNIVKVPQTLSSNNTFTTIVEEDGLPQLKHSPFCFIPYHDNWPYDD